MQQQLEARPSQAEILKQEKPLLIIQVKIPQTVMILSQEILLFSTHLHIFS